MNLLDKILGTLHLNFLNRKNSPSQRNDVKVKNSSVGTIQQAGRDFVNPDASAPAIEVTPDSNVSDFSRYNEVNISTRTKSKDPLVILECTFDGVPTNHGSKKLDDKDVFHFATVNKENIIDGHELLFILKVRKQTGEKFLFKSILKIKSFSNRYDLMVTGDETIERL